MSRLPPILGAFVLGVIVSRWLMVPATTTLDHAAAPAPPDIVSTATVVAEASTDRIVGVPPDTVTPSRPAPNAGQRRALARALEQMERTPVEDSRPVSTETTTVFSSAALDAFHQEMNR